MDVYGDFFLFDDHCLSFCFWQGCSLGRSSRTAGLAGTCSIQEITRMTTNIRPEMSVIHFVTDVYGSFARVARLTWLLDFFHLLRDIWTWLQADVVGVSAAISAFAKSAKWVHALSALQMGTVNVSRSQSLAGIICFASRIFCNNGVAAVIQKSLYPSVSSPPATLVGL